MIKGILHSDPAYGWVYDLQEHVDSHSSFFQTNDFVTSVSSKKGRLLFSRPLPYIDYDESSDEGQLDSDSLWVLQSHKAFSSKLGSFRRTRSGIRSNSSAVTSSSSSLGLRRKKPKTDMKYKRDQMTETSLSGTNRYCSSRSVIHEPHILRREVRPCGENWCCANRFAFVNNCRERLATVPRYHLRSQAFLCSCQCCRNTSKFRGCTRELQDMVYFLPSRSGFLQCPLRESNLLIEHYRRTCPLGARLMVMNLLTCVDSMASYLLWINGLFR